MFAHLLAVLLAFLVNAPAPERLDDPLGELTRDIPESRVLVAEAGASEQQPRNIQETLGPVLESPAYVVRDLASGVILTSREPSAVRPVASLAKILTAIAVVKNAELDDVVSVSRRAVRTGLSGTDMGLVAGENIRVRDLLAGLLIASANDAAVALAEHVAGSEAAFVERMRAAAHDLDLSRTRVENATGFDSVAQFSSAYDVALLLAEAWRDPVLGVLLRTEEMTTSSVDGKFSHRLKTTNRLLGLRSDVLGGKTGFTTEAGESLAVVAESPGGHPVVAAVLGSPDRFGDMENLLNWTFWAYRWPAEPGF